MSIFSYSGGHQPKRPKPVQRIPDPRLGVTHDSTLASAFLKGGRS